VERAFKSGSTIIGEAELIDLRGASAVFTTPGLMARKIKPSSLSATAIRGHESGHEIDFSVVVVEYKRLRAYLTLTISRELLVTQYMRSAPRIQTPG
jgi:hypothetical protein